MKYGDKIKMLRDYDRHRRGDTLRAGSDVAMGVARAWCAGDKPYAKCLSKPKPKPTKKESTE